MANLSVKVVANLQELRKQMTEAGTLFATTKNDLRKMSEAYDGAKLLSRVSASVEAITRMGGVSNLTTQQQARLNREITEAVAKYKALGKEAPSNLLEVQKATQKARDSLEGANKSGGIFSGTLAKLASAFAIGSLIDRGVSTILSLGREAFASAGKFADLADKTGLSVRAVQQFSYVAAQSGGSVDQYADTVFKLGVNLQQGGERARQSMRALGLSYEHIRSMKPEQQFDAIMRALAGVTSHTERNRIGVELMGQSYANVAAAVDGYIQKMEEAPVVSDAAIAATDAAGDAMTRTWERAKAAAVSAIGGIILAWEDMQARMNTQGRSATSTAGPLVGSAAWVGGRLGALVRDQNTVTLPAVGSPSGGGAPSVGGVSADAWSRLLAGPSKASIAAAAEASRAAAELQKRLDVLTGRALMAQVAQLTRDVTLAGGAAAMTAHEWMKLGQQLVTMREQGATLPRVFDDLADAYQRVAFAQKLGIDSGARYVETMRSIAVQTPQWAAAMQAVFPVEELASRFNALADESQTGIGRNTRPGKTYTLGTSPLFTPAQLQQLDNFNTGLDVSRGLIDDIGHNMTGTGRAVTAFASQAVGMVQKFIVSMKAAETAAQATTAAVSMMWAAATLGISLAITGIMAWRANVKKQKAEIADLSESIRELGGTPVWARSRSEQIILLTAQLENLEAQAEATAERTRLLDEGIANMLGAVDDFGGRAPEALHPFINELLTMNGLTAEQHRLLSNLLNEPGWQSMEEAAGRLGVSLAALGPAFAQGKLSEQALQTVRDLALLEEGGADMNNVIRDSAGHIQKLVDTALTTGAALPETLRPYIQKLIDMQLLMDPDGELVRNIDQLSFADIKDDALEAIKEILEQIRDLLQNDIPAAARTAQASMDGVTPPGVPNVPDRPSAPNPQYDEDGTERAHHGAMVMGGRLLKFHRGGMVPRLRPDEVPAILQNGEGVLSRPAVSAIGGPSAVAALNRGGGGMGMSGVSLTVHVYPSPGMNEEQLAAAVARRLPAELERVMGVAV